MNNTKLIMLSYELATLSTPSFEVMQLLMPLPFERTMELLMIMRQQQKPIRSPLNFLRRAIEENWSRETLPMKVDRHKQNHEEQFYLSKGYTLPQARKMVLELNSK